MKRLLLFDIDGTLVRGGPAKDSFHTALVDAFGTAGDIEVHDFAGKTDPQIARELLSGAGLDTATIDAGLPTLWERYLAHLAEMLRERPMLRLPGVGPLLEVLGDEPDVGLGLLTGNIARGAELKLRSVGLFDHFRMGSFGSDHEERDALTAIALGRARDAWSVAVEPASVIVVGDTPRDVQCGRKGGTRTVAVATGRYAAGELAACGADHVFEDLSETEAVLEVLVG